MAGAAVKTWEPYESAFGKAAVVVGNGGTAFFWHVIKEGIPALVIPSRGDQLFNCRQMARLGFGQSAVPSYVSEKVVRLPEIDLGSAIASLEDNRSHAASLSRSLHRGGGVAAAAALLERLAETRAPLTSCPGAPCCC